jgi:hypothetical protein
MEYLVELTPGREVVYDTPLALRAALRSREITSDSRIYHRRSACWVSIMEHPEYRRLLAERRPPDWLEPIPYEPVDPATYRKERVGLFPSALGWLRSAWGAAAAALSGVADSLGRRAHARQVQPAGSADRIRDA